VAGLNIDKITVQRRQRIEQIKILVEVKLKNKDDFQVILNKLSEMPEIIEVVKVNNDTCNLSSEQCIYYL